MWGFSFPADDPQRALLTVPDVAELLQLSEAKTWQLVRDGDIPSLKIDRARRVTPEALHAWIDAKAVGQ